MKYRLKLQQFRRGYAKVFRAAEERTLFEQQARGLYMNETKSPAEAWRVVVNDEEQYSIWPMDRDLPAGWREEGCQGSREECLSHIESVWTDMRPLSVRRMMEKEDESGSPDRTP